MKLSRWTLAALACCVMIILALYLKNDPNRIFGTDDLRPHIVLIYTDDIDCESLFSDWKTDPSTENHSVNFPTLKAMADEGIVFTNFHITTPVCGPSRACLFTGRYAHRNQFRVNRPSSPLACGFSGGYKAFNPKNELGVWMTAAGYETAYVGKYLHDGFAPDDSIGQTWQDIKPPGWQRADIYLSADYYDFHYVPCIKNKTKVIKDRYRTDVEKDNVIEVFRQHAGNHRYRRPLFVCWAPVAAHNSPAKLPMSAPRHESWLDTAQPPGLLEKLSQPLNTLPDETNHLPPLTEKDTEQLVRMWRDRMRAIKALDEGLRSIRDELKNLGELDNTIFIFTSDHGFQLGSHRHIGKRLPYDEITRVPLIVCGKGVAINKRCDQLLANIDLAPTLVELARGTVPADLDGRSFAALLSDPQAVLEPERTGILIENWEVEITRGIQIQATYSAIRTKDRIYTEWATGGREYYDLKTDPEQHSNLYDSLSQQEKQHLWKKLRSLRLVKMNPMISDFVAKSVDENGVIPANHGEIEIAGFAEDDSGIDQVQLEIHSVETNEYWDGQGWTSEPMMVDCNVQSPRGQITRWFYNFDVRLKPGTSGKDVPDKHISVSVRATDLESNSSWKHNAATFTINFDEPETWIDMPPNRFLTERPIELSGRAFDNTAIRRVDLVFKNMAHELYWDGTNWSDKYTKIPANFQPDETNPGLVRWHFTFDDIPQNTLHISARAVDDQGNWDRSIPFRVMLQK